MKQKLISLSAVLILTGFVLHIYAQAPSISPAQYIITIQSSQPNEPAGSNFSRQYKFYDASNNLVGTLYESGAGYKVMTLFVTDTKKPVRFEATHTVHYSYLHCDPPDPGCNGGLLLERNTQNNSPSLIERPIPCQNCYTVSGSYAAFANNNIPISYPYFDSTLSSGGHSVRITVDRAADNNYNLPSSDMIFIEASGNVTGYVWEYQLLEMGNNWLTVPSSLIQLNNTRIEVDGEVLFGSNWRTHLNKTVLFRMRHLYGTTSNILVYTHRLSSPRIVSAEAFNNPCFGYNQGFVKVKFSRLLEPNEKINIFLKDTAYGLDYSALNLTNADIDNSTNTYTWPTELVQGSYKVSLIGKYFDYATYTGSPLHFSFVRLADPPFVWFYLKQMPALCYGGNSGKIVIAAKGGVGNYKYEIKPIDSSFSSVFTPFNNAVFNPSYGTTEDTVSGLSAGMYKVRIRDANNCMYRDSIGNELLCTIEVLQPASPLTVSMLNVGPITCYTCYNGSIVVRLNGGTKFMPDPEIPNPNYKPYEFIWSDSATGNTMYNYQVDTTGGIFQTSMYGLGQGTYRFRAWDANYSHQHNSYNQQGCMIDMYIRLTRPDQLLANIATDSSVKCKGDFNGKLKAMVTGGIPVSDSVKYYYSWFKKSPTGEFIQYSSQDSVLRNVGAGIYRVDVRDKYYNLKQSNLYTLTEPALLDGTSSTTPSSCYFTANGSMTISPSGGTSPYKYEWSTGHLTQTVTGVAGGNYVVVIKDTNMCQAVKQVVVTSPAKITTTSFVTPVGCNGTNSGAITVSASGGAGGYGYLWNTGSTAATVTNLPAGSYWYKVTDANGCYDSADIELTAPDAFSVTAGADRKICTGQTITLTAQYPVLATPLNAVWNGPQGTTNGKTVSVNTPGTYIVTVSNNTGCLKKDTVVVTPENATVNTNFTVSTQVFAAENTTLVNISPAQQDSAQWILPQNAGISLISSSKHYCEMRFSDTGRYVVGIRAFYSNGCIDEKFKEVNVVRKENFGNLGNQGEAFLKQFGLYPNPTSGSFTLNLLFNSVTVARVRVINILTNVTVADRTLQGANSYAELFNIGYQPAGTYVVIIETAKGNFVHKVNKL